MLGDGASRRLLASGTLWAGLASGLSALAALGVTAYLVRVMDPAQYGMLATAIAAATLLSAMSGLGLLQAVPQIGATGRAVHGDRELERTVAAGLRIAVPVAMGVLAATALALLATRLTGNGGAFAGSLLALAPVVALVPVIGVFAGALRAAYRPRPLAASTIVSSVALVVCVLALASTGHRSAVPMAVARSVSTSAAMAVLALAYAGWRARLTAGREATEEAVAALTRGRLEMRLLAFGGAMVLAGFFTIAVSQLDVFILGLVRDPQSVAVYQPVSRILDLVLGLPGLLSALYLPLAAASVARGDSKGVRSLYHWASRWSLAMCSPALALMLVSPEPVLRLLFGSGFDPPTTAARVLAAGAAVHVTLGFNGLTLDAYGQARLVATRLMAALVIDAAACAVLIPLFGVNGAAAGTATGLVAANVLCSVQLWRRFQVPPWNSSGLVTVLAFLASVAMAVLSMRLVSGDAARVVVTGLVAAAPTTLACAFGPRIPWVLSDPDRAR